MRQTLYLDNFHGMTYATLLLVEGETPYLYLPPLAEQTTDGGARLWHVSVYAGPPAPYPHCAHDRKQHDVDGCTWTTVDGARACWCSATYMSLRPIHPRSIDDTPTTGDTDHGN